MAEEVQNLTGFNSEADAEAEGEEIKAENRRYLRHRVYEDPPGSGKHTLEVTLKPRPPRPQLGD